jgi:hypothetical protein
MKCESLKRATKKHAEHGTSKDTQIITDIRRPFTMKSDGIYSYEILKAPPINNVVNKAHVSNTRCEMVT